MKRVCMRNFFYISIMCTSLFCLSACSFNVKSSFDMLKAVLAWNAKDYQTAVAEFLVLTEHARSEPDKTVLQYALYGLFVTYMMQNEQDAALSRMAEISADANPDILYGVFYNNGIIAWNNGDFDNAASFFREALRIKPSSIDAKINLEKSLILEDNSPSAQSSQVSHSSVSESSEAGDIIFSIIKTKEQNQWINQEQEKSTIPDY